MRMRALLGMALILFSSPLHAGEGRRTFLLQGCVAAAVAAAESVFSSDGIAPPIVTVTPWKSLPIPTGMNPFTTGLEAAVLAVHDLVSSKRLADPEQVYIALRTAVWKDIQSVALRFPPGQSKFYLPVNKTFELRPGYYIDVEFSLKIDSAGQLFHPDSDEIRINSIGLDNEQVYYRLYRFR